ncbi:hypothetical protein EUX98_g5516 [Antrodiella citrinella]|uniref:DRBM domain-containing protein n=1 Tax=Antrodiella citrinella TaxID=2447956 RepID=A0A4S4MS72_9APHY|nr:hypothetical protein EUX98_g5516 [Antrodiella citrinella]
MSNTQGGISTRWRLRLNNLLQRSYGARALVWETTFVGTRQDGHWEATAYIREIPYGRATARHAEQAMEDAAHEAYYQLYEQLADVLEERSD